MNEEIRGILLRIKVGKGCSLVNCFLGVEGLEIEEGGGDGGWRWLVIIIILIHLNTLTNNIDSNKEKTFELSIITKSVTAVKLAFANYIYV